MRALVVGVAGGLSAPRRLKATPPEDIFEQMKEAGQCFGF